MQSVAMQMNMM